MLATLDDVLCILHHCIRAMYYLYAQWSVVA
jgi:hypothetical protein